MSEIRSPTPIVLVHGILGFDQMSLFGVKVTEYFRKIPAALREAGYIVPKPPQLNPIGGIAERAQQLKDHLNDENNPDLFGKPVHLIVHSLGGLDARYMISKLDMAERVVSLTTIGTPHHGSLLADLTVSLSEPILTRWVKRFGIDMQAVCDLTTEACERFNQEVLESPKVRYFSIAGLFKPRRLFGKPLGILGLPHEFILKKQGESDGIVSVQSATFGQRAENWTFLGTWEANHFRLINWGTEVMPSMSEWRDETIIEKYKGVAAHVTALEG
ncbi:MAG: hypothetical protein WBK96_05955 [Candidatus Manganitrophaceae bacterium]